MRTRRHRLALATLASTLLAASAILAGSACDDGEGGNEGLAESQVPTPPTERSPVIAPEADPGPRRTRVKQSTAPLDSLGGGGGGGGGRDARAERRAERAKQITKAELLARFAGLRNAGDPGDTDCQQAFAALAETREGMGELLDSRMGGPTRAEYVELCSAFPSEVRTCLAPAYHAAHLDECRGVLERFAATRDDPAWLERLTGHPASERPEPAMTEGEARAKNRAERRRLAGSAGPTRVPGTGDLENPAQSP